MNINITDILCQNKWEYSKDNPFEVTSQGITLYLENDVLYMKYPTNKVMSYGDREILIGPGFDKEKLLKMGDYSFKSTLNELACLKENQEKIRNVYLYLSVILKNEENKKRFYIYPYIDYLNLTDKVFSQKMYKGTEQFFKKYGNVFSKIQKYIWQDNFNVFVSHMFLLRIYNQFCKDYIDDDFYHYHNDDNGDFLIESFSSIIYTKSEETLSSHSELEIMEKMEKILENY